MAISTFGHRSRSECTAIVPYQVVLGAIDTMDLCAITRCRLENFDRDLPTVVGSYVLDAHGIQCKEEWAELRSGNITIIGPGTT